MTATLAHILLIWPFGHSGPGHSHSRAAHARHLRHLQESRTHRLNKCHGAGHPSLIHR